MANDNINDGIPLYNKAPYVCKALDSIVSQSYKDWEI